ncbi:DsbA family oxidoreductase [Deinococcus sp.]|uniref:DsbA family oxidoreductase n=1 Tax=Deinococcus sp. TaxID=47478 RepID=UPI003C79DA92
MTASALSAPGPATLPRITVEIWSDIACPWCYVGKRRFEAALRQFPQAQQVDVVWHSFELDPSAPLQGEASTADILAQKYGRTAAQVREMLDGMTATAAAEGLEYHFELQRPANTFQAHQVIHLAAEHGLQDAMKERLMRAFFTEGQLVSDPEVLAVLAAEVGLEAAAVRTALEHQTYAPAVRRDEAQARAYGIQGVPFFVLGGKYGVSGAQSPETLLGALQQVWSELAPQPAALQLIGAESVGDGCEDGSCALTGAED